MALYSAFFMGLFVFHLSLTVKSVNLEVTHNGITEIIHIIITVTLIPVNS